MGNSENTRASPGSLWRTPFKILNRKRMFPEAIKEMLQHVEITDYNEAKEYAIKQASVLRKERTRIPQHSISTKTRGAYSKVTVEDTPAQDEIYSTDEWLCGMGKGPGKGNKGSGQKGSKGSFKGNCNY